MTEFDTYLEEVPAIPSRVLGNSNLKPAAALRGALARARFF